MLCSAVGFDRIEHIRTKLSILVLFAGLWLKLHHDKERLDVLGAEEPSGVDHLVVVRC